MIVNGVSAEWVLDSCEPWQLVPLMQAVERKTHSGWEQARLISITVANAMGARLTFEKMQFAWESDATVAAPPTDEVIERGLAMIREKAKKRK